LRRQKKDLLFKYIDALFYWHDVKCNIQVVVVSYNSTDFYQKPLEKPGISTEILKFKIE
jgi:hypothetical protein